MFGDQFLKIISNQSMWGGVLATISFVILGFFITKSGLFSKEINGKISKFLITWMLPFFCIFAFMQNADSKFGKEIGIVISLSIVFYILAGIGSWIAVKFYPKLVTVGINRKAEELYEKSDKTVVLPKFKEAYLDNFRQKIITANMMIAYGSLQFFAFPLVLAFRGSIFGADTLALAQIWCIPYMIAAFSYVKLQYAGQKINRNTIKIAAKSTFVNPMMICLFISLILWAIQFIPGINAQFFRPSAFNGGKVYQVVDANSLSAYNTSLENAGYVQYLKDAAGNIVLDKNNNPIETVPWKSAHAFDNFWGGFKFQLPALYKIIAVGVGVVSPMAWVVIGGSLATSNIKQAAKDKAVWIATAAKLVLVPIIMFAFSALFVYLKWVSPATGVLLVLLAATPPAAVCIIFAVGYNHPHTGYTAQVSSLATLLSLIAMPVFVILAHASFSSMATI